MAQYIDKSALVTEIKDLYEDIDKCIGNFVLAKSKHDQRGISDAHWKMETLMVNIQQALSYILQHLEWKEVDLNEEAELIANGIMIDVQANKYNTVVYNTKRNDFNHSHLMLAARKGIELGLKAQKGEEI